MKLVVISHKISWRDDKSPTGYSTIGGFPIQMQAISELFDQTTLVITEKNSTPPNNISPLVGKNMVVAALTEPQGKDFWRKIYLLVWFPLNLKHLWSQIRKADAVHAVVPGDVGFIGMILALIQKKPLLIRHCGTWGTSVTLADRILFWVLEKIAGGKNIVLATGGSETPPSQKNKYITWIFSTTLNEKEMDLLKPASAWKFGDTLRLITVARLSPGKNVKAILESLPILLKQGQDISLSVVGDGQERSSLEALSRNLHIVDKVNFLGNISHDCVLENLSNSHLFIFPTKVREGFPKAVIEGMACGLPVIATGVSVIPHLLQDQCGITLDGLEPENIAKAIASLIADPVQMKKMGQNARNRAREYSLEKWQTCIKLKLLDNWGAIFQEKN